MSTLNDYIAALAELVPGTHPVEDDETYSKLSKAVAKSMDVHSKHKPRSVVEDVSGDGGFDYALADLAAWVDEFSQVVQVEYPLDDTSEDEDILDACDWKIYKKPAGSYLRFLSDTPAADETLRVTYTGRHTCTGSACTVAAGDEEAVQSLGASFYCKMLAAVYAQDGDSTIDADVVNQTPKHRVFLDLSGKFRAEYNDHMGIVPGKPKAAVAISDQDVNYPGGMDRLTHPRRYR